MNLLRFLTPKDQTHYLNDSSTVRQALEKFDYHKFTVVPLVDDDGHFVGTISQGDILSFIKNHGGFNVDVAEDILVRDIPKYRSYKPLEITATGREAYELSMDQNFIPFVDGRGMYIGIVKRKDIISYLLYKFDIFED